MATRRDFIKEASLLAGGAGIWTQLPASIKKALVINPDPGTTFKDAEHIVLLMQENRSFDHCFGTLRGVRGFNDPRAITIPGGASVWTQPNRKDQRYAPFRLNIKDTNVTWIGGLPHSWPNQVDARNEGRYNGWLEAKKKGGEFKDMPFTMGYYTREDIPFYYALADAFTVCDQNFSSSLTGTTSNRTFFWTGTVRPTPDALANVRNSDIYYNREADWKTYPERLEENGISWKVYQNELSLTSDLTDEEESWLANFTDNNLEWFKNYHVRFHKVYYDFMMNRIKSLPGEIKALEAGIKGKSQNQAAKLRKEWNQKRQQLEKYKRETKKYSPANFEKLTAFQKNIHKKAFTTNSGDPDYHKTAAFTYREDNVERELAVPKGDVLYQFRKDVDNNNLPTVSWIVAPQNFSDHPSAPWFGAWFVSEVMDILTKNPEVWKKTIFILNYDENDGYFDHIPPFTAPKPGDPDSGGVSAGMDTAPDYVTMAQEKLRPGYDPEGARESSIGLGYRVPLIIASPWSRGGWVNSEVFDITSTIRFLEKFLQEKTGKDIRETNISDWRRTVCGDLTSTFRPYNGESIPLPDFLIRNDFIKEIYNARFKEPPTDYKQLTDFQIQDILNNPYSDLLPGQEKGVKDSCALPYELMTDGYLTPDKTAFKVVLGAGNTSFGKGSSGAPFNVYVPGKYMTGGSFQDVRSWAFAVKAGDQIDQEWPLKNFENDHYHLRVYGPNGFYREFTGDATDAPIRISFDYERIGNTQQLTGNINIIFENSGEEDYDFVIEDPIYGKTQKAVSINKNTNPYTAVISTKDSYGWYDVSITQPGKSGFIKRYAGRVEMGGHLKTDPFMGRLV